LDFLDKLKGRGKNQAGTPEKAGTPSQEGADENQSPTRNVIWNEEIEKLQIKDDDLKNVGVLKQIYQIKILFSNFYS
jgi:hypothetical protein